MKPADAAGRFGPGGFFQHSETQNAEKTALFFQQNGKIFTRIPMQIMDL